jgi:hypothetical protein
MMRVLRPLERLEQVRIGVKKIIATLCNSDKELPERPSAQSSYRSRPARSLRCNSQVIVGWRKLNRTLLISGQRKSVAAKPSSSFDGASERA